MERIRSHWPQVSLQVLAEGTTVLAPPLVGRQPTLVCSYIITHMAKKKKQVEENAAAESPNAATHVAPASPEGTLASRKAAFDAKVASLGITLSPFEVNSLGLKVVVPVPTNYADFDTLAGETNAALREGIRNILYRGTLAVFRNEFCDRLEEVSKVPRRFALAKNPDGTDKVDTDGTPVVESWEAEAVYVKRVAGDNPEQYQYIADEINSLLTFDPSRPEPKSAGPKAIAKVFLKTAQDIFDQGRGERVIAGLAAKLGLTPVSQDVAGLAALVKEDQRRKQAGLVEEYKSIGA